MAWKKLAPPVPRDKRPAMSLAGNGRLSWTEQLHVAMGEPTHVNVFYDDETHRLGIRPADGKGSGLEVRSRRYVTVRSLLLAEGVWNRIATPLRFVPTEVDEDEPLKMWAIPLADAGEEA